MAVTGDLTRYRYISRLGTGGMARVDLAEDTLLGRKVALKRLPNTADPSSLSRLRREALAGASLSHPNLVSIYDVVSSDDGHLVMVMEYIRGETLRDALDRQRWLPVSEALRVLEGVASGLDAIHAQGIVHRDVKPSNILLGEDGAVKVADLGIAAMPDRTRITVSGSVIGSLSYMAPEQLDEAPSTPAIDTYALAALAYEVLSGEKARRETNPVALAHAMATQPPPDLRNVWPDAPDATAELLLAGMARDPAQRPRSAGELVSRLGDTLAPGASTGRAPHGGRGPAVVAPPPEPAPPAPDPRPSADPYPSGDPSRPRGGLVPAILLGLVVLAVVVAILLNSGGSPSKPAADAHRGSHHPGAARKTVHRSSAAASPPASAGSTSSTSTPTASSSSSSTPLPASPSPGVSGSTGPGSPAAAVETFYGDAAAHNYPAAWALADPALRSELQGYHSFSQSQAGDRSITFNQAQVVKHSGTGATVAIKTTSVRTNGTHHCTGTVALIPAGGSGGWLLHQISITCTP